MEDKQLKKQYLKKQMTFGRLIKKLKKVLKRYKTENKDIPHIQLDFGDFSPYNNFNCYRGNYADVAIGFQDGNCLLSDFLEYCEDALFCECTCRKSDIMTIEKDSLVWFSEDNHVNTRTALIDVVDMGYYVLLITRYKIY